MYYSRRMDTMAIKQRACPACGTEIRDPKTDKCPFCGEGVKRPLHKGLWVMIGISTLVLVGGIILHGTVFPHGATEPGGEGAVDEPESYTAVELQTLFQELDGNADRAKELYQDQYVQFEGQIVILDGDGAYIRVKDGNADAWNAPTILCYVTDREQREFLDLASKGDRITVRGRITGVSVLRGYTLRIQEIES